MGMPAAVAGIRQRFLWLRKAGQVLIVAGRENVRATWIEHPSYVPHPFQFIDALRS